MLAFLIDALACYRLTKLAVDDEIIAEPRRALIEWVGEDSKLAYLIQCPFCMGFWVGCLVVVCRGLFPKAWHYLATALALSAAAGLISEH